jgi:hypothetical protein
MAMMCMEVALAYMNNHLALNLIFISHLSWLTQGPTSYVSR